MFGSVERYWNTQGASIWSDIELLEYDHEIIATIIDNIIRLEDDLTRSWWNLPAKPLPSLHACSKRYFCTFPLIFAKSMPFVPICPLRFVFLGLIDLFLLCNMQCKMQISTSNSDSCFRTSHTCLGCQTNYFLFAHLFHVKTFV